MKNIVYAAIVISVSFSTFAQIDSLSPDDKLDAVKQVRKEYTYWLDQLPNSKFDVETKSILQTNIQLALRYVNFMEKVAKGDTKLSTPDGGYLVPTTRAFKDWARIMKGLGAKCRADLTQPGEVSFPFLPIEVSDGETVSRIGKGPYKNLYVDKDNNIIVFGIQGIVWNSLEIDRKEGSPNKIGAANGSQPFRSETNRTSPAAGFRR